MRFGAPALMPASLVPSNMPTSSDQLLQMVLNFSYGHVVRQLTDSGFHLVELTSDLPIFLPHVASEASIAHLGRIAAAEGVTYTVHLPLWSVEPSTPLEAVRHASTQATIQAIRTFEPLRPERYVYHATGLLAAEFYRMGLPDTASHLIMRRFVDHARRSLDEILTQTGIESSRLAIETITFPFEMTVDLAEEMGLSLCFDTGHVLAGFSGPVEFFAALERALPLLGEIHLHDAPSQGPEHIMRFGEDHRVLGQGDLDLGRLLDTLATASWQGPIIIELPNMDDALRSLDVIRMVRPQYAEAVRAVA